MKKDIQRAALAAIVGALAVMTGCDQSNNSNMKGHGTNGSNGQKSTMQDGTMKQGMDQSAKPMPNGQNGQMHDLGQPQGGGSSHGNTRQNSNGSKYHYYCD